MHRRMTRWGQGKRRLYGARFPAPQWTRCQPRRQSTSKEILTILTILGVGLSLGGLTYTMSRAGRWAAMLTAFLVLLVLLACETAVDRAERRQAEIRAEIRAIVEDDLVLTSGLEAHIAEYVGVLEKERRFELSLASFQLSTAQSAEELAAISRSSAEMLAARSDSTRALLSRLRSRYGPDGADVQIEQQIERADEGARDSERRAEENAIRAGMARERAARREARAAENEDILNGYRYATGQGVLADQAEAVRWYRMAAERGNAFGQVLLGLAYAAGEGIPADQAEAVRWYRMAAEQGEVFAFGQVLLGLAYATGEGLPADYALAHMWLNIAGANISGIRGGMGSELQSLFAVVASDRNLIEETMTTAQIARATELARTCMNSNYQECGP